MHQDNSTHRPGNPEGNRREGFDLSSQCSGCVPCRVFHDCTTHERTEITSPPFVAKVGRPSPAFLRSGENEPPCTVKKNKQEKDTMRKHKTSKNYPTIFPASPELPQVAGESLRQYLQGFPRFSPFSPSFYKLVKKQGYI